MKKRWIPVLAVLICIILPAFGRPEDESTLRLARTLYTLAASEDYETKIALGTVVMNRVENPWYPATVEEVLSQQQQFPCGSRYDEESLAAAHAVLSGKRAFGRDILSYQAKDATFARPASDAAAEAGGYYFYCQDLHPILD